MERIQMEVSYGNTLLNRLVKRVSLVLDSQLDPTEEVGERRMSLSRQQSDYKISTQD